MENLVSEEEYREAVVRFLKIRSGESCCCYHEELEQLIVLMEIYEQENCPGVNLC